MTTEWIADVELHDNTSQFPGTGSQDVWYADMSTASDEKGTGADLYYWNGSGYTIVVGPHPKPRPH